MPSKRTSGRSSGFVPYIPASKSLPEITVQGVILGLILGVVMGAANVYLGLYAGMTVSASIPAAVISMGILRGLMKSGNILENNIVQTMASTSESLAAGIIFTLPALLLTGVWTHFYYWPATLITITGGLLGVLFMIPLRKSHVVEDKDLTFPEGVACAQVLKTGESGSGDAKYLVYSMLVGAVLKFLTAGTSLIKGSIEWAWRAGSGGFYFGFDVSAALVGVGYIIRLNIAALVFIGGAVAWLVALPIMGSNGIEGDLMDWFWTNWSTKIRYMGVGAMAVGGIWSIVSIWGSIVAGLKEAFAGYTKAGKKAASNLRTEINMDQKHITIILVLTVIAILALYQYLINDITLAIVSTASMVIVSFLLVAVASYVVGLVGSSSSPVSGMTICAVLGTGALLLLFGMTGTGGIIATLGVAGVVCCATCTSGDISQDLKTGYLLGATPKKQQWMEVVAVLIPSLFMIPVLVILNEAYGIGTGEPGALKAPQATLFANLVQAMFGEGQLPLEWVKIGVGVGIAVIILDQVLKKMSAPFRTPVMAVAVGIYLPLTLSVPIFLGGLISSVMSGKKKETDRGTLFASGLIAGEAIVGVLLGALIYFGKDAFPLNISSEFLSVAAFLGLAYVLYRVAKSSS